MKGLGKNAIVIGSGFAGLTSACYLAKAGFKVTILEKNATIGGRARKFELDGFTFDMGPSWYWMPDVFSRFYSDFGHKVEDFYDLERLDPSYQVVWPENASWNIPADWSQIKTLFEQYDPGISPRLDRFIAEAKYKYEVGMRDMVYKPSLKISEYFDLGLLKEARKLDMLKPITKSIKQVTSNKKIREILEFPVLFLGAKPSKTPALYSLMNYADLILGTWYPQGGMHKIVQAFNSIALEQGITIKTESEVLSFEYENEKISKVITENESYDADWVVNTADYAHIDQKVCSTQYRSYTPKYWSKRLMAPTCLLFYLGIDRKIERLKHHNLFFDADFVRHSETIYDTHEQPEKPLFYVCCPSKTDPTVAPSGKENVFILIPLSVQTSLNKADEDRYLDQTISRIETFTGSENLKESIISKRTYQKTDFIEDYHAHRGNAYGLANTLSQTAIFKPKIKSKKLKNLYFAGQLTVPGPGVPPSIVSGEMVALEIIKENKLN